MFGTNTAQTVAAWEHHNLSRTEAIHHIVGFLKSGVGETVVIDLDLRAGKADASHRLRLGHTETGAQKHE